MIRSSAVGLIAGLTVLVSISGAVGQVPVARDGAWRTSPQGEGQSFSYSAKDGSSSFWLYAVCKGGGVALTTILPNRDFAAARRTIGTVVPIAFEFGAVRYVYRGTAYEGSSGSVDVDLKAKLDDPLFATMRAASSLRLNGPLGAVDLPLAGAAPIIDGWRSGCSGASVTASAARSPGAVPAPSKPDEAGLRAKVMRYLKPSMDDVRKSTGTNSTITLSLVDLDGDGLPEALMVQKDQLNCGMRGCNAQVLDLRGAEARSIGDFIGSTLKVLPRSTGKWRDLALDGTRVTYRAGKYDVR